jgi:LPXTG-site transpeptidase (sortase) family protein
MSEPKGDMNQYDELYERAKSAYGNAIPTPEQVLAGAGSVAQGPAKKFEVPPLRRRRRHSAIGGLLRHLITIVVLCLITLGILYGPMLYRDIGYWWRKNHRKEVPESLVNALFPGNLANFQVDNDTPVVPVMPPDDRVVIDKIEVNAPIVIMEGVDNDTVLREIQKGVGLYPNLARPGQPGLVFLTAHSSYWWWDAGQWKFVFQHLEDLMIGDKITVYYHQKRYDYEVTDMKVIKPQGEEADRIFDQEAYIGIPSVRLMTCVPVGTSLNRLVVTAKQISPDPSLMVTEEEQTTEGGETTE